MDIYGGLCGKISAINATQVEIEFSKEVDKDTLFADGKSGTFAGGATITFTTLDSLVSGGLTGELSADGKTLTVTATNALSKRYDVVVDGLKSTDGKDIVKYEEMITIAADKTAPTITGVEKVNASTVKVNFSEPLKVVGNWTFKDAAGKAVTVTPVLTVGNSFVTLTIDSAVTAGTQITATVLGAKDQADNLITPNPATVTFTKGDKDGVAPVVQSVTAKGLDKFEIKFSEEVQGLEVGNIYVGGTALTGADTITQDTTDKTKYEVTLGTALTAGLNKVEVKDTAAPATSVYDLSGEKLKDFSQLVEFKADTVLPKFVSSEIVVDATTKKETLVLTFDKDVIQPAAFTTTVATETNKDLVTTTGTLTAGQLIVNPNNAKQLQVALDTVQFSSAALAKDATYKVEFAADYVSDTNTPANKTKAFEVTFKRGEDGTATVTAPTVSTVTATDSNTVTVLFDKAVDGVTATNIANYTIPGIVIEKATLGLNGGVAKEVKLTLKDGTNTLSGDRDITIKNVKAKDGEVMKEVTKTVANMKENVKPTVVSAKFTGVTAGKVSTITVKFSENVNVTANAFEIFVGDATTATASTNVAIASGSEAGEAVITITSGSELSTDDLAKGITVKLASGATVADVNGNALSFISIVAGY